MTRSIHQRLLSAREDLLSAINDGSEKAIEDFDRAWSSLCVDVEDGIRNGTLNESTIILANAAASNVAIISDAFLDLEEATLTLQSKLEDTFSKLTITDSEVSYPHSNNKNARSSLISSHCAPSTLNTRLPALISWSSDDSSDDESLWDSCELSTSREFFIGAQPAELSSPNSSAEALDVSSPEYTTTCHKRRLSNAEPRSATKRIRVSPSGPRLGRNASLIQVSGADSFPLHPLSEHHGSVLEPRLVSEAASQSLSRSVVPSADLPIVVLPDVGFSASTSRSSMESAPQSRKRRRSDADAGRAPKRPSGFLSSPRRQAVSDPLPLPQTIQMATPDSCTPEQFADEYLPVFFAIPDKVTIAPPDTSKPLDVEIYNGWQLSPPFDFSQVFDASNHHDSALLSSDPFDQYIQYPDSFPCLSDGLFTSLELTPVLPGSLNGETKLDVSPVALNDIMSPFSDFNAVANPISTSYIAPGGPSDLLVDIIDSPNHSSNVTHPAELSSLDSQITNVTSSLSGVTTPSQDLNDDLSFSQLQMFFDNFEKLQPDMLGSFPPLPIPTPADTPPLSPSFSSESDSSSPYSCGSPDEFSFERSRSSSPETIKEVLPVLSEKELRLAALREEVRRLEMEVASSS